MDRETHADAESVSLGFPSPTPTTTADYPGAFIRASPRKVLDLTHTSSKDMHSDDTPASSHTIFTVSLTQSVAATTDSYSMLRSALGLFTDEIRGRSVSFSAVTQSTSRESKYSVTSLTDRTDSFAAFALDSLSTW